MSGPVWSRPAVLPRPGQDADPLGLPLSPGNRRQPAGIKHSVFAPGRTGIVRICVPDFDLSHCLRCSVQERFRFTQGDVGI